MSTDNSISIASSAMLVELSISTWTARKLDKKVSTQVDLDNGAKTKVVNANKNLMAGTGVLDTIVKYAANARAWHISQTLPWTDNGSRLLPMSNFVNYKKQLGELETNYEALVDKFIIAYPNLVSAAAFQLGTLFDRNEYPDESSLKRKFKFTYSFFPVPTAGDFRIDINEEAKAEIVANCNSAYQDRLNNAMREAWSRLHDCLSRMSERLTDNADGSRKIFRDSLVENGVELVTMLKHLNITQDPKLELARRELQVAIGAHDLDSLRDNSNAREAVKMRVDSILSKFDF
jgi:hypothetical protein